MADLPNPKYRRERYLYNIASGTTSELPQPKSREERYLYEIANNGGGGGGTTNYNQLSNKPKVNNVELSGNKTTRDLIPIGNGLNFNEDGELEATGGGSGAVDSVNGKTGVVVLDAEDVGALPDDTDIPDSLSDLMEDSTHRTVTDTEKSTWNGKSDFSGNYNDLSNKPSIPDSTSDLTNDSGFITNTVNNLLNYYLKSETYTQAEVTTALADYTTTASLTTLLNAKANASDVEDIEALIPSNASSSNKLITLSDVPNGTATDCPIGMVSFFDDTVAPSGWLVADGTTYNIADYPFLANHFERVHGSKNYYGGNGTTTFAVPDWQGEFFRASGTNSHTNQGSGGNVGEHQDGTEFPLMINKFTSSGNNLVYYSDGTLNNYQPKKYDSGVKTSDNFVQVAGSAQGGGGTTITSVTSRPTNTSLLCCIKAVPAGINYSLEEQEMGTWMGEKLYRKILTGNTGNNAGTIVLHDISSLQIDNLVSISGFVENVPINWEYATDYVHAWVNTSKTGLATMVTSNFNNKNFNITLQYTKTTD